MAHGEICRSSNSSIEHKYFNFFSTLIKKELSRNANNMANLRYGLNNINAGPLREFPEVCIDRFVSDDLKSTAFFVTHGHTDHLVGLETDEFLKRLEQEEIKLYCQALTPILVGSFGRYLGGMDNIKHLIKRRKIVLIENGKPTDIEIPSYPDNYTITVTLLPAGHCPGSVMFLFEKGPLRILHTGDCRITEADIQKMPQLHELNSKNVLVKKAIEHLYIDTTFCCTEAETFPDRMSVITEMIESVGQWIRKSKRHRVLIQFPARFSHEYVLIRLHAQFSMEIHVNEEKYAIYKQLPQLALCTTLNPATQIHFCNDERCGLKDQYTLILRMSSLWYIKGKDSSGSVVVQRGRYLKVCYSMHPSLLEVANIIDYLQPKIVTPLVKPKHSNIHDVEEALRNVCVSDFIYEHYQKECGRVKGNFFDGNEKALEKTNKRKYKDDMDEEPCEKMNREGCIQNEWDFKLSQSPVKVCSQSSDSVDEQEQIV